MRSIKKTARITGILLLIMVIVGPFSMMYVPSQIIVPGDAAATVQNIMDSGSLFNMGIVGHLIILLADLGVAVLLYVLLKPVSRILALVAASLRMIMVAMRGINLVNYFIVILLLNGSVSPANLGTDQLHALVMIFLQAFEYGVNLDFVFFSFHLLFVGYLVFRSGYFPKILGILLIIAFFGYLVNSLAALFFPGYKATVNTIVTIPNAIAELALMLWLLIKGVNVEKWEERAGESARQLIV
ncbi:MAG: DUF4386 domain-containing protein [Bacteroidales bacterium]|jgi:hypothetical protein